MKHPQHFILNFVDCRHFTEMRPIKRRNLVEVKFFRMLSFNDMAEIKAIEEP